MRDYEKVKEHFMKRVKITSTCWIWTGTVKKDGYGMFNMYDHPADNAHRISYKLFKGDIPKGLQIDHLCRFKACVNPDHLEAVTQKENIKRKTGKFRKNPWTTMSDPKTRIDWKEISTEMQTITLNTFNIK